MKHALFDTYAIGSEKALFEGAHHLEIHEIFDYSATYGIVLGAESGVLQKCFNMFKKKNIRDIFKKIEGNIDSIKVTGKKNLPFLQILPQVERHVGVPTMMTMMMMMMMMMINSSYIKKYF